MKIAGFLTIVFGLVTAAVGVWRHVETGSNPQALWFGVVMGAVALIGGLLLLRGWRWTGLLVAAVALAFVGGWFLRRVFTGHEEGLSHRVITILAACAVEALALLYAFTRRKPAAGNAK